jgi:hypothetical protein
MQDKNGSISYSKDDILRLCRLNTFGPYTPAIAGMAQHLSQLEREVQRLSSALEAKNAKTDIKGS